MIIVLEPDLADLDATVVRVREAARRFSGVEVRPYRFAGKRHAFTEIHLIGSTAQVPSGTFEGMPGVHQVVRVSTRYRLVGRHHSAQGSAGFEYNGVRFDEGEVQVFAGLCAVDTRDNVEAVMATVAASGVVTTRMGAYKPRTSPYDFQGLGADCLPWVFEAAGRHGIRVIAMEVTAPGQIEEIDRTLTQLGRPTGVMLQVGTRNAQNFELLKAVGRQRDYPVLYKRGMGITLEESLNACEYIAGEGNSRIVFCLRGVKSHMGEPHRNLVDFAHVPVIRRQTRLPVCIDPSHSVGRMLYAPDGVPDIVHVIGQGVVAGASMVLVDVHPHPEKALCDGPQALTLGQVQPLMRYVRRMRETYTAATSEFAGVAAAHRASA